jgi:hypothetical protein
MVKHPLGFDVPASIAIPDQLDLHMVFLKIVTGLYWYREKTLPADNRLEVRIPNQEDFTSLTTMLKDHCPVQRLGPEIGWMNAYNRDEGNWNLWLFNIYDAVPVAVYQGEAVDFPMPNPAGVVLRDDARFITPGLLNV